jgi:hypothetical protein
MKGSCAVTGQKYNLILAPSSRIVTGCAYVSGKMLLMINAPHKVVAGIEKIFIEALFPTFQCFRSRHIG